MLNPKLAILSGLTFGGAIVAGLGMGIGWTIVEKVSPPAVKLATTIVGGAGEVITSTANAVAGWWRGDKATVSVVQKPAA